MKTFNIIYGITAAFVCLTAAFSMSSCSKDVPIGDPVTINAGYDLPQTGASDEDNARIMNIYEKWSSYVLYDVDSTDVYWKQIAGTASSGVEVYRFVEGDPQYVGDMLDYLDDIWWHYFSDEFLQSGGIPFRVYLVEEYYYYKDWGSSGVSPNYYMDYYMVDDNAIIISGMSQVASYDEDTKRTKKRALVSKLFQSWISRGLLGTPEEFYTISDYTNEPDVEIVYDSETMTSAFPPEDIEELRTRGFIPKYANPYSPYNELLTYSGQWTSGYFDPSSNDFDYYISQIFNATDETVAEFLKYDAVATKWNIILDYYKDNYDIDLRFIATE